MSDDVRADARRLLEALGSLATETEARRLRFKTVADAPVLLSRLLAELDRADTLSTLHARVRAGRGAFSIELGGVKMMACDERGRTNADREVDMLRGQLDAALATLQQVRELSREWGTKDYESRVYEMWKALGDILDGGAR
ncbi:hypothetical protein SEA_EASLEY_56 [Gordonia phage Easley]|uniref:Uncharacterized protein n=1 Tax=Gordonia phage Easley TaxID=2182395 RepID=A0A2U8UNB3_9CAUD|nr:hypothetical protein PP510_gp56 [Gordonia phage Easley]AWN05080.1 hypothetical protein SEA_EASLEY_56 [Gordonia phage Easley]